MGPRGTGLENLILATDSYKLGHWNQYPHDTEAVYSYLESRPGAEYPYTVFFGLQYILKNYLTGYAVPDASLEEARTVARNHFGAPIFNYKGWSHLITEHNGRLPLRIKAVPEGTPVPTGNVMMTVENTCPECYWLTNAVESILTHVWYSSTVATQSRVIKERMKQYLDETGSPDAGLQYMLHDFGYRGASSHESAAIGGAGHLINFVGTDTLPAMMLAKNYYNAELKTLAFSVPATEHSVMTARGPEGEFEVVEQLLKEYPEGILSVVADSYDTHNFVTTLGEKYKDQIMARDGKFVVRPDSGDPVMTTLMVSERLWDAFGGTTNQKGFRVLDPHVGVLWGDGIGPGGIYEILQAARDQKFAAENYVFGMGGGLLQKVNRDTQRFAFKCSAQKRGGEWHDVYKEPTDKSKVSKRGRLSLVSAARKLYTVPETDKDDLLQTVFENGELKNEISFDRVRKNARLP
jgi:nicotinamide phosphoribosyltransferase